jgi:hypothetical protein
MPERLSGLFVIDRHTNGRNQRLIRCMADRGMSVLHINMSADEDGKSFTMSDDWLRNIQDNTTTSRAYH